MSLVKFCSVCERSPLTQRGSVQMHGHDLIHLYQCPRCFALWGLLEHKPDHWVPLSLNVRTPVLGEVVGEEIIRIKGD